MVKQISWDGNQWMGYDDAETIAMKTGFANNRCLGGTMIWSIDFDSGSGRLVLFHVLRPALSETGGY